VGNVSDCCPNESEDSDGSEDEGGHVDLDNDGVGIRADYIPNKLFMV